MENLPTIKLGSTGYYVTILQLNLSGLGVYYEKLAITGFFDEKTNKYTKIFQEKTKLNPNGIVEMKTWKSLFENVILIQKSCKLKAFIRDNLMEYSVYQLFNPHKNTKRSKIYTFLEILHLEHATDYLTLILKMNFMLALVT